MARNAAPKKKVTFSLSEDVVEEMKWLVKENRTWSQNRFVEQALLDHMKRLRREMLKQEFARASRDPLFMSDIRQVEVDFGEADAESSGLTA